MGQPQQIKKQKKKFLVFFCTQQFTIKHFHIPHIRMPLMPLKTPTKTHRNMQQLMNNCFNPILITLAKKLLTYKLNHIKRFTTHPLLNRLPNSMNPRNSSPTLTPLTHYYSNPLHVQMKKTTLQRNFPHPIRPLRRKNILHA
jgi:hypothetical protein